VKTFINATMYPPPSITIKEKCFLKNGYKSRVKSSWFCKIFIHPHLERFLSHNKLNGLVNALTEGED
jgi:hypothetical protein